MSRMSEGDSVTVKVESATDLWRIDRIFADYSSDLPVTVRTLAPVTAIDNAGKDVAPLLSKADNSYYATLPGDYAYLKFTEIPPVPGKQRFYVLESEGYYHQWYEKGEKDQTNVIERIINDPPYGSRMLLSAWKAAKAATVR